MNNDLVYLNRRAAEERFAALNCQHIGVREIHLELANAYEFRMLLLKQMAAGKSAGSSMTRADEPSVRINAKPGLELSTPCFEARVVERTRAQAR